MEKRLADQDDGMVLVNARYATAKYMVLVADRERLSAVFASLERKVKRTLTKNRTNQMAHEMQVIKEAMYLNEIELLYWTGKRNWLNHELITRGLATYSTLAGVVGENDHEW